jgi:hypothetical protein
MNRIFTLLLLFPSLILAQELPLTIADGGSISLKKNATLNIAGLELTTADDHVISGPNVISRFAEAYTSGNNSSIKRGYSASSNITEFSGTIVFNYLDNDLNGIAESDLVLELKSADGSWTSYEGTVDETNNKISYVFNNKVSFEGITASAKGASLTVEDIDLSSEILIYPNPTANQIFIRYKNNFNAQLFDVVGKKVLTTSDKTIDMNAFKSGTYILKLTNEQNNTHSFKIIKN